MCKFFDSLQHLHQGVRSCKKPLEKKDILETNFQTAQNFDTSMKLKQKKKTYKQKRDFKFK